MKNEFLTIEEQEIFNKFKLNINDATESLLLCGTPGIGKTKITRLYADKHQSSVWSVQQLISGYESKKMGFVEELKYSQYLLLDDITNVSENNIFGNKVNIIEEILLARFDHIEAMNHGLQKQIKDFELNQKHRESGRISENDWQGYVSRMNQIRQNYLGSSYITIINSNMSPSEMKNVFSDRLLSRMKSHLKTIEKEDVDFRNI